MQFKGSMVTSIEGIIDNEVDKSIHNLTRIGKDAMDETDKSMCLTSL